MTVELVERLVQSSLVGAALALVVWALCRLAPGMPATLRCWLWWGVALKMLLGLLPLPAVELALLPAPVPGTAGPSVAAQREWEEPGGVAGAEPTTPTAGSVAGEPAPPALWRVTTPLEPRTIPWTLPVAALWLAGAAVSLGRAATALRRAGRAVREAEPIGDAALLATFEALRARLDAPRAELRLAPAAATPQVVGALRPVVLLPAGMRERLDADALAMALGHELLHVRRADLLRGLVPALAARCFFFHPLARLVEREHALAREEACDAAVVARLAPSPRAYGRLLLELASGGPPLRAAAAAITHHTLQRRLQMLLRPARPFRPVLAWSVLLLGLCALAPLRLVAREATATEAIAAKAAARAAASAHEAAPARAASTADEAAAPGEVEDVVEAAAVEPMVLASVGSPPAPLSSAERRGRRWNESDDAWIYFRDRRETSMSGSTDDIAVARRYQRGDEPMLWVRHGGEQWVIRDRDLLARLEEAFAPMRELGAKQAELGARQADLGARQAELGARQAELGGKMATLGGQMAELAAQVAQLGAQQAAISARMYRADDAERTLLESQVRELERAREGLDGRMEALSDQQGELGRQQSELGSRQGELGERQGELGGHQGELGKLQQEASELADRALGELVEHAIRDGLATKVP